MTQYYRKNAVILPVHSFSSFSISDRENLRVLNFIQIYLFPLFQSAILDPLFWIFELWTIIYNQ